MGYLASSSAVKFMSADERKELKELLILEEKPRVAAIAKRLLELLKR